MPRRLAHAIAHIFIPLRPKFTVSDCAGGHYGAGCDQTCGLCAQGAVCSKTDGRCPAACDGDYTPPYCKPCEYSKAGCLQSKESKEFILLVSGVIARESGGNR